MKGVRLRWVIRLRMCGLTGTFFVRNVAILRVAGAAAPQLFRVRATCLRDGEAITGQSDFFSLTPAQTFFYN